MAKITYADKITGDQWLAVEATEVKTSVNLLHDANTGTNTGDQTSISGITGTKSLYNTSLTDGTFMFVGDAPTSHTHTESEVTDLGTYSTDIHANIAALDLVSGTNTGDQTSIVGITGTKSQFNTAVSDGTILYVGDVTSNATHTGDVTGSVALTIAAAAVDIAMLSATGTPTSSNFLRGDNTWATPAGSGDMVLADAQTNSGIKTFLDTTMKLRNVANTFDGYFVNTNTANRIYTLQNAAGTLAFTSDITGTNSGTNTGDQTIPATGVDFDPVGTDNSDDNAVNTLYSSLVTDSGEPATLRSGGTPTLNTGVTAGEMQTLLVVDPAGTDNSDNNAVNTLYSGLVTNATHTGDVAGATTLTIGANKVTLSMMATIATDTFLGRITASTGNVEVLTNAQAKTALDLTGTNSGDQTIPVTGVDFDPVGTDNSDDNAVNTLYSGLVSNATHTGDVTGSVALTIAAGAVDLAMMSATGTPTGSNFLRGDNTWATPAGSGDMVLADAQTNSGIKTFENTTMKLRNVADTFDGYFVNTNTADRIYTLQDSAGTLAFTSDITGTNSGTNTGDQTTIVGITGTKAQFDTAVSDGNIMYDGDAPTSHTHAETDLTGLRGRGAVTIVDPVAGDDATLFFTEVAITVSSTVAHITGTTNVVYNINHATTRNGTGLDVFTADITLTSVSGQSNSSGFNDATIPANSWVWLDVVSVSGTPTMFSATVNYTED